MVQAEDFRARIEEILSRSDLSTISSKKIRTQLESEYGTSLKMIKEELTALINECFIAAQTRQSQQSSADDSDSESHDQASSEPKKDDSNGYQTHSVDSDSEVEDTKPRTPSKKKKSSRESDAELAKRLQNELNGLRRNMKKAGVKEVVFKKKRKRAHDDDNDDGTPKKRGGGGLSTPLILSPELSNILNGEVELSRPQVVKRIWEYIKDNNLQDPNDKRFIFCDEKLKGIFRKERINAFGMNKDLSAHLRKKEEIVY